MNESKEHILSIQRFLRGIGLSPSFKMTNYLQEVSRLEHFHRSASMKLNKFKKSLIYVDSGKMKITSTQVKSRPIFEILTHGSCYAPVDTFNGILEAITTCRTLIIEQKNLTHLRNELNIELLRSFYSVAYKQLHQRAEFFIELKPEQRVARLLRSELYECADIKDNTLPSYIGVTPVGFSRIKTKILSNNNNEQKNTMGKSPLYPPSNNR